MWLSLSSSIVEISVSGGFVVVAVVAWWVLEKTNGAAAAAITVVVPAAIGPVEVVVWKVGSVEVVAEADTDGGTLVFEVDVDGGTDISVFIAVDVVYVVLACGVMSRPLTAKSVVAELFCLTGVDCCIVGCVGFASVVKYEVVFGGVVSGCDTIGAAVDLTGVDASVNAVC